MSSRLITSYRDFAAELTVEGILCDPWVDGAPRFRMTPVWLDRVTQRALYAAASGEERDWPLSRRQMRYLEYRHRVYFPWKVFYELMPNPAWEQRASAETPGFTREARRLFPRTVAFVARLPFTHVGRCNLLGLQSNDHGTIHRDAEDDPEVGHFITLCPRGDKRLYLWDERTGARTPIERRAYWFDDRNYHGVEPAPHFRYSIRVDGVFTPRFLARLERDHVGR